jgi:hypothetical protein
MFKKIRKDIKKGLPKVEKLVRKTGADTANKLDQFLTAVVEGGGKFMESPFKDLKKEEEGKTEEN